MFVTQRDAEEYELENPIVTLQAIETPNYNGNPKQIRKKKILDPFIEVYAEMDDEVGTLSHYLPQGQEYRLLPTDDNGRTGAHGARDCLYITGASGSGKTTYAIEYAKKYRQLHPDRKIALFSTVFDNDDFVELGIHFYDLKDKEFINSQILCDENSSLKADEFINSLVIFDDLEVLHHPLERARIQAFQSDLLTTGRHNNTSVIVCTHLACNGAETKPILNECNFITIFPDGSTKQIKYLLENYAGFSPKIAKHIMGNRDGRWVTIYNRYPKFIFNRHAAIFPSELEKTLR